MIRHLRRERFVLASLLLLLALATSAFAQQAVVSGVDAVGMTVSDLDRAVDFYTRVLHFQRISDAEIAGSEIEHVKGVFGVRMRTARLKLGDEQLEVTEFLAPQGQPIPPDSRSNDRWFQHVAIIVSDMDKAYAWLRQNKVKHASSGPQTLPQWNKNAAGIKAFYFRDPDGHNLEVLQFPPGKGDPKWQRHGDLFLGIDHTAIVVSDTERSLAFYRDTLGMRVAGESENYGTEQEHLNNVHGARLRITSLRAASGPGVELLEYLAPRDGRAAPPINANDLAHWETIFRANDTTRAWNALRAARAELVSSSVEQITSTKPAIEFIARDPDRHAVAFVTDAPAAMSASKGY